ncbi:hypothetical protein HU200_049118 [Digitaria exilis]|uniref:Polygalacturonase n=1 Tax=Digitaria exilis TaxID=1010633 RepID=A0A835ECG0_9POAL|nr:hypothetical protein HU200_049118 [Digitaria exilis]
MYAFEDSTVSVSQDAISLKSGWDKYGISFGRPTSDIRINRVDLRSSSGAALAFGSEMSGGISNVIVNHIRIHDSYKRGQPNHHEELGRHKHLIAGALSGIDGSPFTAICLSNLNFSMAADSASDPGLVPTFLGTLKRSPLTLRGAP